MNEDGTFTSERRLPDSIETKVRSDSKSGFESSTDDDDDDDDDILSPSKTSDITNGTP